MLWNTYGGFIKLISTSLGLSHGGACVIIPTEVYSFFHLGIDLMLLDVYIQMFVMPVNKNFWKDLIFDFIV